MLGRGTPSTSQGRRQRTVVEQGSGWISKPGYRVRNAAIEVAPLDARVHIDGDVRPWITNVRSPHDVANGHIVPSAVKSA